MRKHTTYGFTLVELSIVIVIIALLTAGVMSGKNIVKLSKLQNVIKEIKEIETATHSFKDKFKYYPGDFPSATTYWPSASPAAVNGNGNWQVPLFSTEDLQFWVQLNLASLLPGKYTGAASAATWHKAGENCPKSTFPNGGYDAGYHISGVYGTNGNFMEFGALVGSPNGLYNSSILTSADAHSIDTKMDDGLASNGNLYTIRGANSTGSGCVTAASTAASASYILTDTAVNCRLWFWFDKNKQ